MILRRISKALKGQDWFVVTIEVMIVVVGIFIGLQVDEWNTDRINDERAIEVIEELEVDFARIEESAVSLANFYNGNLDKVRALMAVLDAGVVRPEDEQIVKDAILLAGDFGDPPPPSGIFRELISSGNLSVIRNKELRLRLMEYDQSIGMIEKSDLNINILLAPFVDARVRHSRRSMKFSVPDKEDLSYIDVPANEIVGVDYQAILDDPEFRVSMEQYASMIFARYINIRVVISKIHQVQSLLEAEVSNP